MIQVGITGGIGSGKSTVCKVFEALGVSVFYADAEAKTLINSDHELQSQISEKFGKNLFEKGVLNRQKLANIVFNNNEALLELNNLVHPKVGNCFENWVLNQKTPYVLKEAAILFESGSHKSLKKVIYVSAPQELRIERVCKRDNVSKKQVLERIKNQWPEKQKEALSDFVILNDDKNLIIPQILKIHQMLIS